MEKDNILKKYFGYTQFREGQAEIIDSILASQDVLCIMPTGAGKSICYQVPALLLEGITIVVSPLISLMQDQVNALVQSGVNAAYLNSSLTAGQYAKVLQRAWEGRYKIIYVAPERLMTSDFVRFAEQTQISMVTVDEAHCISQWGQDFRPSYLKIVEFIELLSYRPIVSAFTATATEEVREDITCILRMSDPVVMATGFNRENLYFEVQKPTNKLNSLLKILKRNSNKSGIIYCSTRKTVEDICNELNKTGFRATRYHAGLSDSERHSNQDDFLYDRKPIMVATNAFGMGIDKSNVAFVIHYNMPKNIESYYQEAGRAGRDGEPAECILLYNGQDVRTNQFLIDISNGNPELTEEMQLEVKQRDLERLKLMTFYCSTNECLRAYILKYFGEASPNFCENCSNCNTNFETVDISSESQRILFCVYQLTQLHRNFGKTMIVDILHGSQNEKIHRFQMDVLSSYRIMHDLPAYRIRSILDYLIENGYIRQTDDQYPVIKLTERSVEILRDKKQIFMKLPEAIQPNDTKKEPGSYELDYDLFNLLKELRRKFAVEAHVPAYIIFSDAALRDMCRILPQSNREFLKVSGVGNVKMERYANDFTGLIKEYIANHPAAQPSTVPSSGQDESSHPVKTKNNSRFSAYQSWNSDEDLQLGKEYRDGLSAQVISNIHKRTTGAINSRLKKLGLKK